MNVTGEAVYVAAPVLSYSGAFEDAPACVAMRVAGACAFMSPEEARRLAAAIRSGLDEDVPGCSVRIGDDGVDVAVQLATFVPDRPKKLAKELEWAADEAEEGGEAFRARATGSVFVTSSADVYATIDGVAHVSFAGFSLSMSPEEAMELAVAMTVPHLAREYAGKAACIVVDDEGMTLVGTGSGFRPDDPERLAEALEKAAKKAAKYAARGGCEE